MGGGRGGRGGPWKRRRGGGGNSGGNGDGGWKTGRKKTGGGGGGGGEYEGYDDADMAPAAPAAAGSANGENKGGEAAGGGWKEASLSNDRFDSFYKQCGAVKPEEWDAFIGALRRPLPIAIRVNASRPEYPLIAEQLASKLDEVAGAVVKDHIVSPPVRLNWYPRGLAWQLDMNRTALKRSAELKAVHTWITHHTEDGMLSRQETVSMIPPLLLDVQPHHRVLDMCAAPGSKTAQLIEALHAQEAQGVRPTGMVIANDVAKGRAFTLAHQVQRLASPCSAVSLQDASAFPSLSLPSSEATPAPASAVTESNGETKAEPEIGVFDRILCDAPCSGDGTVRKNIEIWDKWTAMGGVGMHKLQLNIAWRGLQLLKIGGLLVYSTCSMHPAEDEAVIAEILRRGKGAIELVDVSTQLPGLVRLNGLTDWKLMDLQGNMVATWDALPAELQNTRFRESMFPPQPEELEWMNIPRCVRILPHAQDTGGFFIALLRKTAAIGGDVAGGGRITKQPPQYIPFTAEQIKATKEFYGISDDFPWHRLAVRRDGAKVVYLMPDPIGRAITAKTLETKALKLVTAGQKVFSDHFGVVPRLSQDGAAFVAPFMSARKCDISLDDLLVLLRHQGKRAPLSLVSAELRGFVEGLPQGVVILQLKAPEGVSDIVKAGLRRFVFSVFRSEFLLTLQMTRPDAVAYVALLHLYGLVPETDSLLPEKSSEVKAQKRPAPTGDEDDEAEPADPADPAAEGGGDEDGDSDGAGEEEADGDDDEEPAAATADATA